MESSYKYIIVDENVAMKTIIPHILKDNPNYALLGYFSSATDAFFFFEKSNCDLMFLSAELSEMEGFEILDHLTLSGQVPYTIMIAAEEDKYSKKAHLYYDKGLIDFVSKFAGKNRFSISLNRFEKIVKREFSQNTTSPSSQQIENISIITKDAKIYNIPISHISYFIHQKNCTYIYTAYNKRYSQYISLKQMENLLPETSYLQINRNCIVMSQYIVGFKDNSVLLCNLVNEKTVELPISLRRKNFVFQKLQDLHIPFM